MTKPKLVDELPAELKALLTTPSTAVTGGRGHRQRQILSLLEDGEKHVNDLVIGIWRIEGEFVKQNTLYTVLRVMVDRGIVRRVRPAVFALPE